MTGFGLNQKLRTTLRVIAVVVGLMACVVPQIALGQLPFHASSGAVAGEPIVEEQGRGFGAQFTAGHIAGKTIGRTESVSHIGLMPFVSVDDTMYFMDSRLARANRGGLAWSFGGGARHYLEEYDSILGFNGYYDRDQITGGHFEGWGAGAELLGPVWDFRGNWYNPFGTTNELLGTAAVANSAAFVGTGLEFDRIRTFSKAFKGFDAEAGVLLPGEFANQNQIRGYGGGYWYDGGGAPDIQGWKARLEARPCSVLELGLMVSDDNLFNTNIIFNAAIHFGGFRRGTSNNCPSTYDRITQRVRRNQTMVLSVQGEVDTNLTAVNPATGVPFTIAHVNSNAVGPFLGTVDDPFIDIQQGQAVDPDIIFVHAGSQFPAAPENVIIVADDQRILGEGFVDGLISDRTVTHTITVDDVGDIILPASPSFVLSGLAAPRPLIGNSLGANAVTLGNSSEFSGFVIDDAFNNGIAAIGTENGVARENDIINAGGDGILLQNTTGTFSFVNTAIIDSDLAGLHIDGGSSAIRYSSTSGQEDPGYGRIINNAGPAVLLENTTGGFLNMSTSTLDDDGGEGIIVRNAAGGATFDNVSIVNSTATGILIDNSSGAFTFRNTIRDETVIDGATAESVSITNLLAGGQVSFGDLQIDNRQSTGINMTGIVGNVRFNGDVLVSAQTLPVPALTPGVAYLNAAATGSATFGRTLNIEASSGNGILISGNQVDPPAPAPNADPVPPVISRSSFTVAGQTTIDAANLESILITNDDADIEFNGITINNRNDRGLVVDDARGRITLNNATIINNEQNILGPAMDIQDSPAPVTVESLTVTNGLNALGLPAGLNVVNNIANAQGSAAKRFNLVNINTAAGTAVQARDNTSLTILDGIVTAVGGDAIDMENSTLFNDPAVDPDSFAARVSLETVNSAGGTNGIRLVNMGRTSRFTVTGDPNLLNPGITGGTITGATNAGVFMQNGARVSLRGMLIDNNENGIIVFNDRLDLDNPDIFDDDLLQLLFCRVTASNTFGLLTDDLMSLNIEDSQFDFNGDVAATGRETMLLRYNTLLNDDDTTEFDEFENPFVIRIVRTMILDETTDSIEILNTSSANGAHLDLLLQDNTIQNADTSDPAGTPAFDNGLNLNWNGPVFGQLLNNAFSLTGGNQDAMNLTSTSTTDVFAFNIFGNSVNSTLGNDRGLFVRSSGPSILDIQNNVVDLTGGNGEGFVFQLAAQADVILANNAFVERTDGGGGIIFNSLAAPANLVIEGNVITLFDQVGFTEEGIVFRSVAGQVNLSGNTANIVQLGNPGAVNAFIETIFFMPAGTNIGQINVNGFLVP